MLLECDKKVYETTRETMEEKEKEKKGKKRCGEQGGTEDRDEMLGGSANSTTEYVR